MPLSIRAHLAIQPDSASLESLAVLADRALASEKDVELSKHGVAEIQVNAKLVGLLQDISRRLNKLETATAKKKNYRHKQTTEHRDSNVQPKPCIPNSSNDNRQGFLTNNQQAIVVLTFCCYIYSKIMLFNRPTQPMHLFAIIIKHLVIKHTCAETLVRFL